MMDNKKQSVITMDNNRIDIDKIAAEICYAYFADEFNYGGVDRYWVRITEKRKEIYRKQARAAIAEIERQQKAAGNEGQS